VGPGGSFTGVEWPKREYDRLPPYSDVEKMVVVIVVVVVVVVAAAVAAMHRTLLYPVQHQIM
jgi:cell division protein FtsL